MTDQEHAQNIRTKMMLLRDAVCDAHKAGLVVSADVNEFLSEDVPFRDDEKVKQARRFCQVRREL